LIPSSAANDVTIKKVTVTVSTERTHLDETLGWPGAVTDFYAYEDGMRWAWETRGHEQMSKLSGELKLWGDRRLKDQRQRDTVRERAFRLADY